MTTRTNLPHLEETIVATSRYLDALTVLSDQDVRGPSLLPGWSRGHVITHLARNADGLANLLRSAQTGEMIPMYESQEKRDSDIEEGSGRPASELVDDAVASAARWLQVANELDGDKLERDVFRTPGAVPWPAYRVGVLRRTEVEVHHADLDIGYTAHNWPSDFVEHLLQRRTRELADAAVGVTLSAPDIGGTWTTGDGPTVTGAAADLAWWLVGRGAGAGLVSSSGSLPELGRWA